MKFSIRNFCFLAIIFLASSFAAYSQTTPSKPAETKPAETKPAATPEKAATPAMESKTAPSANATVEGKWDLDIDFNGQTLKATLVIKKEKDEYTGTVTTDNGDGKITKGTFAENKFDGIIAFSLNGQPVQIGIKSSVDKDKMKGVLTPEGFGELPFTGTKAKE